MVPLHQCSSLSGYLKDSSNRTAETVKLALHISSLVQAIVQYVSAVNADVNSALTGDLNTFHGCVPCNAYLSEVFS